MTSESERLNIVLSAKDRELARAIDRATARLSRMEQRARGSLGRTSQAWDDMGRAAVRSGQAQQRAFNISSGGRFVLQNTAAQVGDMAVQFESGTAASRIMAQQLPQLFGGLGALGGALGIVGPLLGTVAAVGIPAAAMFLTLGGNAEEAETKVQDFATKLSEAEAALGRLDAATALAGSGGIETLLERYGEFNQRVRDLTDALADIELRAAKVSIGAVLDEALGDGLQSELDRVFGTVGSAIVQAGSEQAVAEVAAMQEAIRQLESEIAFFTTTNQAVPAALTDQLVVMNNELAALQGRLGGIGALADELLVSPEVLENLETLRTRLEDARAAGDFIGIANTISDMRAALQATGVEIEQSVIDKLTQAEDQARQFGAELGQVANAADVLVGALDGVPAALSAAIPVAARLSGMLGAIVGMARGLSALGGSVADAAGLGGEGGSIWSSFEAWRARAGAFLSSLSGPAPAGYSGASSGTGSGGGRRRSGGGGGRSGAVRASQEVRDYQRALERLDQTFEDNEARAAGYRETLEELRAQYEAGEISGDEFRASVDQVGDAFTSAARRAEALRNEAADTFASIVTGSRSASDALSNLLGSLAGRFAKSAFSNLFGSLPIFDGLAGLLGARRRDLPGLKGPRDGQLARAGAGASAGPGVLHVTVDVSGARGDKDIEDMVDKGVARGLKTGLVEYDRKHAPRSVRRVQSHPRVLER